jgi:hypothetical protein
MKDTIGIKGLKRSDFGASHAGGQVDSAGIEKGRIAPSVAGRIKGMLPCENCAKNRPQRHLR